MLRGFLGIVTGSALAQLMAFAALPVLSRLYSPSDTAHYALLLGIGAVLGSFAGLRLDLAIPIPEALSESKRLFWLAALTPLIVLPVSGAIALILIAVGALNSSGLSWVDYLAVAAFVIVVNLFSAASQLAIRLQSYGLLGRIPVIQMIGTLGAQVGLGIVGFSRGLFLGGLFGRSLGIARLMQVCRVSVKDIPERDESRRILRRYWRFPAIFAPANLINVLGSSLAALLLPSLFGFGPAGLYAMADRISGVPVTVLSQSAGQVFLGEFARASSGRASVRVFLRWSVALSIMAAAVASAIWILAPMLLPRILGGDWQGTAQLAQYTGVMAGAAIIGSPVQNVWTVRQQGFMQFVWNVVRLTANAAVIVHGAHVGDSLPEVIATLAFVTCGVYALAWLGALWAAGRPPAGDVWRETQPATTA